PLVAGMDRDLVGVLAHRDPRDRPEVGWIQDTDRPPGPVGDEEPRAVAGHRHVIGPGADRRRVDRLQGLRVDGVDRPSADGQGVEALALGIEGEPAPEGTWAFPALPPSRRLGGAVASQATVLEPERMQDVAATARPPDLSPVRRDGQAEPALLDLRASDD